MNEDVLLSIMSEEKPNQVEQWKIPKNRLKNTFHRELHSRKWKKPLSKHWNYTGNGKKAGNDRHFDTREKSTRWWSMRNQPFSVFPSPHTLPLWFTSRLPAEKTIRSRNLFSFGRSEIPIPCMTAGSKQHKATTGVPDGRLF